VQAKKIAETLNTTVGYLVGEAGEADLFKDTAMLKRLNDLDKMDNENKNHILHVIDAFIKSVKFKNMRHCRGLQVGVERAPDGLYGLF